MKVFMIFSWFEVWYVSSLNTWKQQDLGLNEFKGEKCQSSNQEKKGEYPLLVLFLFIGPIILANGMKWYNI